MKPMTNLWKDTLNYLRVETQYIASQNGFIFRGVTHADADVSATNKYSVFRMGITENKNVSRQARKAANNTLRIQR